MAARPVFSRTFLSKAWFRRVVRVEEERPLEVVRIRLEEVHELVKLNQLCGHGFCRIDLLFVEDEILMPFQLVTIGYLALGNLVSLFAK